VSNKLRILVWFFLAAAACSPEPSPGASKDSGAAPSSTSPGAAGGAIGKTDVTWTAPASFKLVPSPTQMRLATYQVARAEGDAEDGEMTVSQAKGTVAANIQRWEGQFTGGDKAKISELTVGDFKISVVEIAGTYKGMGGAAKEGFTMLAAIVDWPGRDPHFFKLTGPTKTVQQARPAFDELLQTLGHK